MQKIDFKVVREAGVDDATPGKLYYRLDSGAWVYFSFTLEDQVREVVGQPVSSWKVKGATAIPLGTYDLIVDMSTRFKKNMPHVLNVPGFDGIRVHGGNKAVDTEGCLLVAANRVSGSKIQGSKSDDFIALLAKYGVVAGGQIKSKILYTTVAADSAA